MITRNLIIIVSISFLWLTKAICQNVNKQENPESLPTKYTVANSILKKYPHAVIYGDACGGTIISPTWILTAAHCTLLTKERIVEAGPHNSESSVIRNVKRSRVHPLFSIGPHWHNSKVFNISQIVTHWDLMLVELEKPLPLDNITMKAAVINNTLDLHPGLELSYAGYGTREREGDPISKYFEIGDLHEVKLVVEPDSVCSKLEQFESQDLFCAKAVSPRDTVCPLQGDGGSGLVDREGQLVGVASWAEDDARNCSKGKLVVFSRVAAATDWINQVTNEKKT